MYAKNYQNRLMYVRVIVIQISDIFETECEMDCVSLM